MPVEAREQEGRVPVRVRAVHVYGARGRLVGDDQRGRRLRGYLLQRWVQYLLELLLGDPVPYGRPLTFDDLLFYYAKVGAAEWQ